MGPRDGVRLPEEQPQVPEDLATESQETVATLSVALRTQIPVPAGQPPIQTGPQARREVQIVPATRIPNEIHRRMLKQMTPPHLNYLIKTKISPMQQYAYLLFLFFSFLEVTANIG